MSDCTSEILPLRFEDIPNCLSVIGEAWSPHIAQAAQDDLRDMFTKARFAPFYYVAHCNDEIIGLAGYITSWKNWSIADLIYTAVRPIYQRRGIATALIRRCLVDTDALGCNVMLTTYVPSVYVRLGFEVLAENLICADKPNTLMLRRSPISLSQAFKD